MRKIVEQEINVCDVCNKEDALVMCKCLKCGVEHYWDCKEKHGIRYNHAVFFSGDGDGYYCLRCDAELRTITHTTGGSISVSKSDNCIHKAYLTIQTLAKEQKVYWEDFKKRQEAAENALKELQG